MNALLLSSKKPESQDIQMRTIITHGLQRSGSTALYNILRFMFMELGHDVYGAFGSDYDMNTGGDVHVIKAHILPAQIVAGLKQMKAAGNTSDTGLTIVTSHRDLRDIAASVVRMGWEQNDATLTEYLSKIIEHYEPAAEFAKYNMRYEHFLSNPQQVVQEVAEAMGVVADDTLAATVVGKVNGVKNPSPDQVKEMHDGEQIMQYDPVTLMHTNHRGTGEAGIYKTILSDDALSAIEDNYGDWLRAHGYA